MKTKSLCMIIALCLVVAGISALSLPVKAASDSVAADFIQLASPGTLGGEKGTYCDVPYSTLGVMYIAVPKTVSTLPYVFSTYLHDTVRITSQILGPYNTPIGSIKLLIGQFPIEADVYSIPSLSEGDILYTTSSSNFILYVFYTNPALDSTGSSSGPGTTAVVGGTWSTPAQAVSRFVKSTIYGTYIPQSEGDVTYPSWGSYTSSWAVNNKFYLPPGSTFNCISQFYVTVPEGTVRLTFDYTPPVVTAIDNLSVNQFQMTVVSNSRVLTSTESYDNGDGTYTFPSAGTYSFLVETKYQCLPNVLEQYTTVLSGTLQAVQPSLDVYVSEYTESTYTPPSSDTSYPSTSIPSTPDSYKVDDSTIINLLYNLYMSQQNTHLNVGGNDVWLPISTNNWLYSIDNTALRIDEQLRDIGYSLGTSTDSVVSALSSVNSTLQTLYTRWTEHDYQSLSAQDILRYYNVLVEPILNKLDSLQSDVDSLMEQFENDYISKNQDTLDQVEETLNSSNALDVLQDVSQGLTTGKFGSTLDGVTDGVSGDMWNLWSDDTNNAFNGEVTEWYDNFEERVNSW